MAFVPRRTASNRRRALGSIAALLAAVVVATGTPASAAPAGRPSVLGPLARGPVALAPSSPGDEGGSKSLRDTLEAASKGHIEAKAKLDNSVKRQGELGAQLGKVETRLAELTIAVAEIAVQSYRVGRLSPVATLLNSASPEAFLERAAGLETMAQHDDKQLRALTAAREEATRAKSAIDVEVREQQKQLAIIAQRKKDAERALAAVGGRTSGGFVAANSPSAKAAPRNSDGSWPKESCTVDDPTPASGCITPRTLNALNQAQAAGYKRYVSCFRSGGSGEHPKGRACDFASATDGFKNANATGGDRTYGNNLAAYFVKNASRLGVLYVIWYRQIWMPGTGWRSYSGGGSPAASHTNHVHLSMV
jgi:peptidoglycan DL-endopeptidase CwlO